MKEQKEFQKLSEFLKLKIPGVNLTEAKKAITAYREYMFNLRGGKDFVSHYCDICYKRISIEQANKTTIYDFNYVCEAHEEYRSAFQISLVRHNLGIKAEDLPDLEIFE